MVKGILNGAVMQSVSQEMFRGQRTRDSQPVGNTRSSSGRSESLRDLLGGQGME